MFDWLLFFVDVTAEEYFGGEVVGVSAQEAARGVGALGVPHAVALGVFEEVEVEHLGLEEVPVLVGCVDQVARHYDLVEEVPRALICQCADATVEDVPPGVEELVSLDAFGFALGAPGPRHTICPWGRR